MLKQGKRSLQCLIVSILLQLFYSARSDSLFCYLSAYLGHGFFPL